MQKRVLVEDFDDYIDQKVRVKGFFNSLRAMGKLNFLLLRDRTGFAQVLIQSQEELKKVQHLQAGSILSIAGKIVKSEQAALGFEIIEPLISVEVPIHEVPPVDYYKPKMQSDLDFILDHRAISLRNRKVQAVFKLQAEIAHAYRNYMYETVSAVEYFGPNIIGASSEGGAEFFNVDYFGYSATLAQSSQLYKQIMVGVNERVFAIMPFFRAEPSHTTRHLAEGKQLEFEIGFFDHWHELLDIIEGCTKTMADHLRTHCQKELALLETELPLIPNEVAFPRLTFAEAQAIYFEESGIDERGESDLSPAAERLLCSYAKEKWGTECVIVTDWQKEKRPFYSYPSEDDPTLTNTFDLLCRGIEVTSGGQRRHTYDSMVKGIEEKGMNPEDFEDYLSIFKYGMPPHGGFGLGLERLTMTFLGLHNIREVSLFPSDTKRIASHRLKAQIYYGSESVRNEIIRLLKEQKLEFQHLTHSVAATSEESATARGTALQEGVKSIILKGKKTKKNYHINLPAHLKLDMKAVAKLVGEKCEFEDPKLIEERFGLTIGSIPPFGQLLALETFFDTSIANHAKVAFNCGLLTESIVMKSQDLVSLIQPTVGDFSKE